MKNKLFLVKFNNGSNQNKYLAVGLDMTEIKSRHIKTYGISSDYLWITEVSKVDGYNIEVK